MKKIKFLLLILPFLFITNVNAEQCDSIIDLQNARQKYPSNTSVLSYTADSITFNATSNYYFYFRYFKFNPNQLYIITFDVGEHSSQWDINKNDFLYIESQGSAPQWSRLSFFNDTSLVYQFLITDTSNSSSSNIQFTFNSNNNGSASNIKITNFKVLTYENYIACNSSSSGGGEEVNLDLSGIIPYLLLISTLLMIIILRDFIKSLFK